MIKTIVYAYNGGLVSCLDENDNPCAFDKKDFEKFLVSLKRCIKSNYRMAITNREFITLSIAKSAINRFVKNFKDIRVEKIVFNEESRIIYHKLLQYDIKLIFQYKGKGCLFLLNCFGDIVYSDYSRLTLKEYLNSIVINIDEGKLIYSDFEDCYDYTYEHPNDIKNYIKMVKND